MNVALYFENVFTVHQPVKKVWLVYWLRHQGEYFRHYILSNMKVSNNHLKAFQVFIRLSQVRYCRMIRSEWRSLLMNVMIADMLRDGCQNIFAH